MTLNRRLTSPLLWLAATAALISLSLSPALADQDNRGTQAHMFDLTTDDLGIHTIDSPETLSLWSISAGVFYDRAKNPVEFGRAGRIRTSDLVREQQHLVMVGAVGLPFNLQLGLAVPYAVDQDGFEADEPNRRFDPVGFGDLRYELKWQAWRDEAQQFSVGAKLFGTLPTGEPTPFRSWDDEPTVGALVLLEARFDRFRVLTKVGYRWIEEDAKLLGSQFDDQLLAGIAGEFTLLRFVDDDREGTSGSDNPDSDSSQDVRRGPWNRRDSFPDDLAIYELALRVSIDAAARAEHLSDESSAPVNLGYSLQFRASQGFSVEVGGQTGLSSGVGAPDYRLWFGLRYTFGGPKNLSGPFAND